jgi:hypothetical protein
MFEHHEIPVRIDVPVRTEVVNGREVTIAGADTADDRASAMRGNSHGYGNTASLAAGALFLRSAASESDLVSRGVTLGLCTRAADSRFSGGVSADDLARLLRESNAANQVERGYSLEDLAQDIEAGARIIAFVNSGELWDSVVDVSGIEANYPVLVEGVARDAHSQEIAGFLVRDPAAGGGPAFVDADRLARSWLDAGGWQIVPSV